MSDPTAVATEERPDEGYSLSHELLQAVEAALDAYNLQEVEKLVVPLHSAVMADLLEQLHPEDRRTVVGIIRPHLIADAEVLTYLDDEVRAQVMELLAPEEIATALAELDSDDALGVIEGLEDEEREKVLEALPTAARVFVEEGLTFPEYSAGRLMQREIVAVPMFWTVGKTIDWLRETEDLPEDFYLIFAVDPMYRPIGSVPLARMLRSKRPVKVGSIISEDIRPIPAEMDQEEVAFQFRQYGLVSAPVVDKSGRLLGVVTVDDIVDVIDEEAEDDLLKMGGVREDDLYHAVVDTTKSRFSWLGVNLVTAVVASLVISLFEATIEQIVALAVLMPIVASMGGNAGTQSLTVAVRGLAMRELTPDNAPRVLWKEVLVGSLNGIIFAAIAAPVASLWFGDWMLGVVIASAMLITLIAAGFSGTVIPLVLERLKVDPAVASGVFLTTVTDVVGFFAFLGLAAWILI